MQSGGRFCAPPREMVTIGDPAPMIELLRLLLAALIDALRSRQRLLLENLLLRQQLQVAIRNQRRPHLRTRDKLFWLLVHRLHGNWRRHDDCRVFCY
jgi:hypothetical protein